MHSNFLHRYDFRRRLSEADLLDFIEGDWQKLNEAQKSAIEEMGEYMGKRSPLDKVFIELWDYEASSQAHFATGDLVWVNENEGKPEELAPDIRYYRALQKVAANQREGKNISLGNVTYWQPLATDPRSTIVRDFVVDIALYRLTPANSPVEIANQFRQFYDDAIAWCKVYMKSERPTQLPQEPPTSRGILIAGGRTAKKQTPKNNSYNGW